MHYLLRQLDQVSVMPATLGELACSAGLERSKPCGFALCRASSRCGLLRRRSWNIRNSFPKATAAWLLLCDLVSFAIWSQRTTSVPQLLCKFGQRADELLQMNVWYTCRFDLSWTARSNSMSACLRNAHLTSTPLLALQQCMLPKELLE